MISFSFSIEAPLKNSNRNSRNRKCCLTEAIEEADASQEFKISFALLK